MESETPEQRYGPQSELTSAPVTPQRSGTCLLHFSALTLAWSEASMMDIAAAIGAVSQGIGVAKALRTIDKAYDEATYRAQIADLMNALSDAKLALINAKETLSAKDEEIARLEAAFEQHAALVKGDGDYDYYGDEGGRPKGFPVCPKCHNVDRKLVQLKQDGTYNSAKCPVCATAYKPVTNYLADGLTAAEQRRQNMEASMSRHNSKPSPYY